MRIVLVFLSLFLMVLGRSQVKELSENEVISKYDQISVNNLGNKSFLEINRLYKYSESKSYRLGILRGLMAMQQYYLGEGNYEQSLNYSEKALENAKRLSNNDALSRIYMHKGTSFAMLDMHVESKKALNIAIKYAKKIRNIVDRNIQLSKIYTTFAGLSEGEDLNDSILYYSQKSLNILESTSRQSLNKLQEGSYYSMLIDQYLNMGSIYSHFIQPPNLKKAENYYSKALDLSRSRPDDFEQSAMFAYFTIGHFYFQKKEFQKSIKYFEKVLEREKIDRDPNRRLATYDNLKNIYDSIEDIPQQNKYLKLYGNLNDSLLRIKNKSVITHSDKQAYFSELKINNLRKYLQVSIGIAAVLLVGISVFFRKKNKEFKRKYITLIKKLKEDDIEAITYKPFDKNKMSSEKEKVLVNKLTNFEASEKFLKKNLTLSYLSHALNTNPKYLSQIINLYREQNFNGYINRLRINYISHKLYHNPIYREYKISYLAEECGYASSQVFINAFKKETGMTPSYFIQELKNQNSTYKNITTN
ncbi:helix-turn-helix domain-containing protein [Elizabethkingia anophelis]|uniref:Transcriptional regulator, AraC family n=1 Tax=Elizabethkingia anophelis TaxID=1117645 RepID=A0A455ZER5_9FLAO|nr:helix-turn-helix domain-containing protein [Elizabethkingia anophelis]CAH1141316.1 hypothetical protein EAVVTKC53_00673 [Elizabethkingia anophelis]CAI9685289.1 hypothetical protein EAVVTKC53_02989 [Elizabethkingia anophelis]DAC75353.1 TPA_exp: transcriptional regulator, AraC family [Elizabethkingia anophelis]